MAIEENSIIGGRYRLTKRVGKGAFGEVWLAQDEQVGMEVAIKIYIALDDRGIKDFKSEYSNTFQLNHQNLLHASYFDVDGDRPFLVMPYCPGSALDLIDTEDEKEIWKFIRDTAAGLEYLHDKDIIHRDIKPDNILKNADGTYLITDFGVSLKMKSTLRRNSTRGQNADDVSGTHAYMGPELFSSSHTAVKATDIWALGASLFEILTGELPFFGQSGSMMLTGAQVPDIPSRWSPNLQALVKSCLDADTWNRPTATELRKFADSVLDGQNPTWSTTAQTPNPPQTSPSATAPQNGTAPQDHTKQTAGSRTKTIVISEIIAAAILIAGLSFFLLNVFFLKVPVTISTTAFDPIVTIDGQIIDSLPSIKSLRVGNHTITIADPDFDSLTQTFEVIRDSSNVFSFPLEPIDKVFTVNGVSFKMIGVHGGTFQMGAAPEQGSDANPDESPVHSVTLSSFRIGETEVTQELWQAVMGSNPSRFTSNGLQCPVESVSWDDCQSFISKLNKLTGKNFRLPTEAEWEFAARGGNKSKGYKYSGSDNLGSVAWYLDNSGNRTHAVKTKSPNELGIYDMSGNVYEWCSDWYGTYPSGPIIDPKGPSSGAYRVNRGGSYCSYAEYCRVSYRGSDSQSHRFNYLGLRLAF